MRYNKNKLRLVTLFVNRGSWPEYTAMCTGSYAVSQTFV